MPHARAPHLVATLVAAIASTDASGPGLYGAPFFRGSVDGTAWTSSAAFAFCGDCALIISAPVATLIPNTDLLEVRIGEVATTGDYELGDSVTGRFAHTLNLRATGPTYRTSGPAPGRVTIAGIDFTDSLVAGTFRFKLTSEAPSADVHTVAGSFRLPLSAIYTVEHPEGTPCHGAT